MPQLHSANVSYVVPALLVCLYGLPVVVFQLLLFFLSHVTQMWIDVGVNRLISGTQEAITNANTPIKYKSLFE